jgi:hypothetical protein
LVRSERRWLQPAHRGRERALNANGAAYPRRGRRASAAAARGGWNTEGAGDPRHKPSIRSIPPHCRKAAARAFGRRVCASFVKAPSNEDEAFLICASRSRAARRGAGAGRPSPRGEVSSLGRVLAAPSRATRKPRISAFPKLAENFQVRSHFRRVSPIDLQPCIFEYRCTFEYVPARC